MRALLITFLLALPGFAADPPALDVPVSCGQAEWPAHEVMEALGFRSVARPPAEVVYQHVYNTRDWRQFIAKVKNAAKVEVGALTTVYDVRPYRVSLIYGDYRPDWRNTRLSCQISIDLDFVGHESGIFTERRQRYLSNGTMEAALLPLFRNQIVAQGLIKE
jgi:hypothetical protein